MTFILGVLISLFSLYFSMTHLGAEWAKYYDLVALLMVVGGTLSVAVVIFPASLFSDFRDAIKHLIFGARDYHDSEIVTSCLLEIKNRTGIKENARTHSFSEAILRDGEEMISLGFSREEIEDILGVRIDENYERFVKVGGFVRSLSKYPPAFGLGGTVLGLVRIMGEVSKGAGATQAGYLMSLALIATLYGILLSNLVISPIGEKFIVNANRQRKAAQISLQAVLLMSDKTSLLKAQEILNSFIHPIDRVNIIREDTQVEPIKQAA
ncbi:MAG: MotA/TolQ/ExbB proton channel family protein [Bacteriovoracaceae bacterium]|nr:MotA/TolQ/ExbB proton channel family protein [Bacteriovoracaceae bacterium]